MEVIITGENGKINYNQRLEADNFIENTLYLF